jgi:hypothetical protein
MEPGTNKMRRTVFTIHPEGKVVVSASSGKHPPRNGAMTFSREHELRKLAEDWPGLRLLEIWNQLSGVKKVTRFKDRDTAIRRIWNAVQELEPQRSESAGGGPRRSTKTQRVIGLLKGPSGASLQAIMEQTGWQPHSVRGFISGQLSKRMGFQIQSFKRNGERIYRIRS